MSLRFRLVALIVALVALVAVALSGFELDALLELLSGEALERSQLASQQLYASLIEHMNPGAVFATNTTGSFDVLATAQAVFAHTYRYTNFFYASDRPLQPEIARLTAIRRPDGALFSLEAAPPQSVAALLTRARLEPVDEFLARRKAEAGIITDDNLLSEYRHGRRFGPEFLQALLPPEPAQFGSDDP